MSVAMTLLAAAVITATPSASPEVLEPSVMNEVEHALSRSPAFSRFSRHDFGGSNATERALAVIRAQGADGRWTVGNDDFTFAAVSELKRLAYGDGSFKVLMIGNSFSISNCRHMPAVAKSLGVDLELGSLYIGGCSLQRHWQNVLAATNAAFRPYDYQFHKDGERVRSVPRDINIPEALRARRWDVVTIQQCSHESWRRESYHPWGDDLVKYIRELAPQAEIVVQETWSYTPFDARLMRWGIDQNEMYAKLHEAYRDFAEGHSLRVIAMGTAVQRWRERLPVRYGEADFGGDVVGGRGGARPDGKGKCDVFHLHERGEYLQSLVWTAALLGVDVTVSDYLPKGVTAVEDTLMKRIAVEVSKSRSAEE